MSYITSNPQRSTHILVYSSVQFPTAIYVVPYSGLLQSPIVLCGFLYLPIVPYSSPWFPTAPYNPLWQGTIESCREPQGATEYHRALQLPMVPYSPLSFDSSLPWYPTALYSSLQLPVIPFSSLKFLTASYGPLWFSTVPYNCLQLPMAMYSFLQLCGYSSLQPPVVPCCFLQSLIIAYNFLWVPSSSLWFPTPPL